MNKDIKVVDLSHNYKGGFEASKEYLASMPDLQNSDFIGEPIDFVGISGFHLPLLISQRDGGTQEVMATVTGSVSLDAQNRGINMSRILRTFYKYKDEVFSMEKLKEVLEAYQRDLDTFEAHILLNFKYRMWQRSLVSRDDFGTPNGGWQYYNVTFDCNLVRGGKFTAIMWLDFVYSSACPCSTALSNHAALERGMYGIPHSQRSVARIGLIRDEIIWIEDLVEKLRETLLTEVLVFCKREDEQDFALRNGAQPKFVEDAARIIGSMLMDMQVEDYSVLLCHSESLHNHNAFSIKTLGKVNSPFASHVSFADMKELAQSIA